jgi:hypothetical protein
MDIITRAKDAIAVLSGRKQVADNTIGLQRPVSPEMQSYDDIAVKNDRKSKIVECRQMDEIDPRIARCHKLLSSDASVNGFTINIASAISESVKNDAKSIIDLTQSNCKIQKNLSGWIYDMLLEGDLFGERDIDEQTQEIKKLKKLEPLITFSNIDSYGNYDSTKPTFKQTDPYIYEKVIAEFWDYQIGHTGWQKRDGKTYGTPLFAVSRKMWRRLDQSEISVVGMRRLDAGDTVHWSGFTTEQEIIKFRENNKDSLANPMKPVNYYYTTGNVIMNKVSGSRNLGMLNDLDYLEGLVFMPSGVPIALVSGGREKVINRDVFEDQLKSYYRVIQSIDDTMEQWLRETFDIALLLKGIVPESLVYTFNWGAKDRDDIDIKITRGLKLQELGIPFEIIVMIIDLDGVEYQDIIDKIKKQIAEGIVPYGLNTKMDPNLIAFLSNVANYKGIKTESVADDIRKLRELSEMAMSPDGDMAEFRRL